MNCDLQSANTSPHLFQYFFLFSHEQTEEFTIIQVLFADFSPDTILKRGFEFFDHGSAVPIRFFLKYPKEL